MDGWNNILYSQSVQHTLCSLCCIDRHRLDCTYIVESTTNICIVYIWDAFPIIMTILCVLFSFWCCILLWNEFYLISVRCFYSVHCLCEVMVLQSKILFHGEDKGGVGAEVNGCAVWIIKSGEKSIFPVPGWEIKFLKGVVQYKSSHNTEFLWFCFEVHFVCCQVPFLFLCQIWVWGSDGFSNWLSRFSWRFSVAFIDWGNLRMC